jgi:hypothetical protein
MEGDLLDPVDTAAVFDSAWACGACVIKEGGLYKVWYTGWNGEFVHVGSGECDKINFRIGYATSPDAPAGPRSPGAVGRGRYWAWERLVPPMP